MTVGWAALIQMILTLVGPLLSGLLENCTKKTLKAATKDLPAADTFGSEGEAAAAMIDAAIAKLPKLAFVRRKALLALKRKAIQGTAIRTKPLTAAELKEGKKLLKGIRP